MPYEEVKKALELVDLSQLYFKIFEENNVEDSVVKICVSDPALAIQLKRVIPIEEHLTQFINAFRRKNQAALNKGSSGTPSSPRTMHNNSGCPDTEICKPTLSATIEALKIQESNEEDLFEQRLQTLNKKEADKTLETSESTASNRNEDLHSDSNVSTPLNLSNSLKALLNDLEALLELTNKHNQIFPTNVSPNFDNWLTQLNNFCLEHFGGPTETSKTKILTQEPEAQSALLHQIDSLLDNPNLPFLAKIMYDKEKFTEALKVNEIIYRIQKSKHGEDNNYTLYTQHQLALCWTGLKEYNKAKEILQLSFEKRNAIFGPNHEDTLMAQHNIAYVLKKQQDFSQALILYQQIYDTQNSTLGPDHLNTISTQHEIANCLGNLKEFSQALELYKSVFDKWNRLLGPDHGHTLTVQNNMASILENLGKYKEALEMFSHLHGKQINFFGHQHPLSLRTKSCIERISKKIKN